MPHLLHCIVIHSIFISHHSLWSGKLPPSGENIVHLQYRTNEIFAAYNRSSYDILMKCLVAEEDGDPLC